MKERKYKGDWTNEIRFDGKTGKEKRVPVYRGDWFRLTGEAPVRRLFSEALLPWIVYTVLIILYFKLNFPGAVVLYVFLPAALSLFPALYWILGAAALFRTKEKMTRLEKEKGIGRVLRSAAGCTICSLAALAGDAVFLCAGGQAEREWPGTCMILLAAVIALGTLSRFRATDRYAMKEEGFM